nr:dodecin family protein [Candidatus Sigynarchaeota archaeon]
MSDTPESIYKIIDLIGTSEKSWEDAVRNVIETAGKSVRDLRVAEVDQLDVRIENNKIIQYRARVRLSFKYEKE